MSLWMVVYSDDSRSRGFCLIIDDRHNAYGKAVKVILGALEVGYKRNNAFTVLILYSWLVLWKVETTCFDCTAKCIASSGVKCVHYTVAKARSLIQKG